MKIKKLSQAISLSLVISHQVNSAEFVVTTTGDESGDVPTEIAPNVFAVSSLRSALELSNNENTFPGPDVISFDEDLFETGANEILVNNGELLISSEVTIDGPGSDLLTLNANNQSRLITIDDSTSDDQQVFINGVTMTGGNGNSEILQGRGGCVLNRESLTVNESVITRCEVGGAGGGLWTLGGDLNLIDSWVVDNSANRKGGGLYLRAGQVFIENSTIIGNSSNQGGGVYWERSAIGIMNNVTVSTNVGIVSGGGMFCDLTQVLTINNSTLINNGNTGVSGCNDIEMNNSIIAGHNQADCQFGNNTNNVSMNHVVDTDGSCDVNSNNHTTISDPLLEPLLFIGGKTPAHRPLPNSPVIDAGDDNTCLAVDQRGISRPQDGDGDQEASCDIGAVEYTLFEEVPIEVIFSNGFESVN